jgi:hypothetical protein
MTSREKALGSPSAEGKPSREELEAELDESLAESFPASDPPAWVNEARVGTPRRDKAKEGGAAGTDAEAPDPGRR